MWSQSPLTPSCSFLGDPGPTNIRCQRTKSVTRFMPHPCLPLILLVLFLLPGNCWGWALGWGEARRRRALSGSPGGQQREHGWAGQQMMKGKQRQSRWHKAPRARAENQPMEEPSSLRARWEPGRGGSTPGWEVGAGVPWGGRWVPGSYLVLSSPQELAPAFQPLFAPGDHR